MVKGRLRLREVVILLLGLLLLGAWVVYEIVRKPSAVASNGSEGGRNVLSNSAPGQTATNALAQMTWPDVAATAEAVGASVELRQSVLDQTTSMPHPPVCYLRALLFLAQEQPEAALGAFSAIAPERIPPRYLYGPYRLQKTLRPAQPNPYLPHLRRALSEKQLEPLIEARLHAETGDLAAALASYLQSDPAQWANYDLTYFQAMRQHAGVTKEARTMILGALNAGRVPDRLRTNLTALLSAPSQAASPELLKARLAELFKTNTAARQLAVTSAIHQLEVRRQFLGRHYRDLLNQHYQADPLELPDETVLLLTLAAARTLDYAALDRWSQELKRRYPDPEVIQWLKELKTATQ